MIIHCTCKFLVKTCFIDSNIWKINSKIYVFKVVYNFNNIIFKQYTFCFSFITIWSLDITYYNNLPHHQGGCVN